MILTESIHYDKNDSKASPKKGSIEKYIDKKIDETYLLLSDLHEARNYLNSLNSESA